MEVSLSEMGGLSRRLEVAVPANEVAREVQARLKRLSRTARLKGFRPGKAPLAVIRSTAVERKMPAWGPIEAIVLSLKVIARGFMRR